MKRQNKLQSNYGVVTDLSKSLNELLGDESGRTVSNRTAEGVRRVFNTPEMDDDTAEGIVHVGMVSAAALLNSPNESTKTSGMLLSLALFVFYQSGK